MEHLDILASLKQKEAVRQKEAVSQEEAVRQEEVLEGRIAAVTTRKGLYVA